jgi:hypothetical protein
MRKTFPHTQDRHTTLALAALPQELGLPIHSLTSSSALDATSRRPGKLLTEVNAQLDHPFLSHDRTFETIPFPYRLRSRMGK